MVLKFEHNGQPRHRHYIQHLKVGRHNMQSACHRLKYVAFPHMCKSATQILHIYIYIYVHAVQQTKPATAQVTGPSTLHTDCECKQAKAWNLWWAISCKKSCWGPSHYPGWYRWVTSQLTLCMASGDLHHSEQVNATKQACQGICMANNSS